MRLLFFSESFHPQERGGAGRVAADVCRELHRRGHTIDVLCPSSNLAIERHELAPGFVVHNLPAGGTVRVTTSGRAGTAMLTVENTGEPLSEDTVATLAEPFLRGSERVRSGHGGAGLGLTIARSITQAHGGTLTLAPRDGGGLQVTVLLGRAG